MYVGIKFPSYDINLSAFNVAKPTKFIKRVAPNTDLMDIQILHSACLL